MIHWHCSSLVRKNCCRCLNQMRIHHLHWMLEPDAEESLKAHESKLLPVLFDELLALDDLLRLFLEAFLFEAFFDTDFDFGFFDVDFPALLLFFALEVVALLLVCLDETLLELEAPDLAPAFFEFPEASFWKPVD